MEWIRLWLLKPRRQVIDRPRLERLFRDAARPPLSIDRLEALSDGRLRYWFKTAWRDGTTHAIFEPLESMEKLAALVPTPRAHLVRFHGLLGPAAKWRPSINGFATAVGLTRIGGLNHFPSDVLVGAVMGELIGRYVVHHHAKIAN